MEHSLLLLNFPLYLSKPSPSLLFSITFSAFIVFSKTVLVWFGFVSFRFIDFFDLFMMIAAARNRKLMRFTCSCSSELNQSSSLVDSPIQARRWVVSFLLATAASSVASHESANAVSTSRRALRGAKIPESEYTTLPNGLKYYDLKVGGGPEAKKGSRVAVHYVAKWKNVTFMTSRQGIGVTGGTPYGFDVGQSETGNVLKGLDLGVEGMRVGGQRLLIVPPQLAYGSKGVQEIPPNATIELDVELLSIKQTPFGTGVKIIEG